MTPYNIFKTHPIPDLWFWFIVCFVVMLITTYFMGRAAQNFYLQSMTRIKFSIFDLEFPGKPETLPALFKNIDNLPNGESQTVRRALLTNLLLDFLFMPATYIGILLLCVHTATRMEYVGKEIFATLALLQLLAWLFDIIENIYLLRKMSSPAASALWVHKLYIRIVTAKWAIATTGAVCAIFGTLYFWLMGQYRNASLVYLGIIAGLIGLFIAIQALGKKKAPQPIFKTIPVADPRNN